jgi:hypothetical protein
MEYGANFREKAQPIKASFNQGSFQIPSFHHNERYQL